MLEKDIKKAKDNRYYVYYFPWSDELVVLTTPIYGSGTFDPLLTFDNWQDTEKFIMFAELFVRVLRGFYD